MIFKRLSCGISTRKVFCILLVTSSESMSPLNQGNLWMMPNSLKTCHESELKMSGERKRLPKILLINKLQDVASAAGNGNPLSLQLAAQLPLRIIKEDNAN